MKIGVLALQGDFAEHQVMLHGLGVPRWCRCACPLTWKGWTG